MMFSITCFHAKGERNMDALNRNEKVADALARFGKEEPFAESYTRYDERNEPCGNCAYGRLAEALMGSSSDATSEIFKPACYVFHDFVVACPGESFGESIPFNETTAREHWKDTTIGQLADEIIRLGGKVVIAGKAVKSWSITQLLEEESELVNQS
jgi:hypothetical protein